MTTKELILKLLEKNRENFTSGEDIASQLGISRNAIWKAVEQLRKQGYIIESKSKLGYRLDPKNIKLNIQSINTYLETKVFGQNIHIHDILDSTNQKGKELAAQEEPSGTLILANKQTAGRGRRGREFYSPEDTGIYMSLIIRPENQSTNLVKLTTMAALATCEAIEELTGLNPKIKWVNDIYLNGKKLVGILTEATTNLEDGNIDAAILGIGININVKDFPEALANIATSLDDNINRNQLIAMVLNKLELLWNKESTMPHIPNYKSRLLVLNKQVTVLDPKGAYDALVVDLDSEGALIVQLADSTLKTLNSGEISIKGDFNE